MNLPYFHITNYQPGNTRVELDEENSRHAVQVLRMKQGDPLRLTDGKGYLLTASITEDHKKHCLVTISAAVQESPRDKKSSIAISLLKNSSRLEWFVEKATEIGVFEITPLLCARTEREKFRMDRMQQIAVSAMLQSQQAWMPVLHQPMPYELFFRQEEVAGTEKKFIAHCEEGGEKKTLVSFSPFRESIILIGPEGDFTEKEIALAVTAGFIPVSLGSTRLRSETAGIVAAAILAAG